MFRPALIAAAILTAAPALADGPVTRSVEGAWEDVVWDIENAITGAGLVISSVNHVGEMLARTGEDVGSSKTVFTHAQVYGFCSAVVSREVMEADPMNLAYCPYRIFLMELPDAPGVITVGHPLYPAGDMDTVNALLDGIVDEALGMY